MFLKQTNVFCVKHFFNCAVFVVCLRLTVFVCCFAICLVPLPSSSCLITWFLWLFVLSHKCHKSTHWLCSALLCLLCCADPAMLMQCTLVVQHSCCCCFCPVRKAFVVVIVKLVLPVDVTIVTIAVFHQCQVKKFCCWWWGWYFHCLFIWIFILFCLFVALIACVPELHCFGI